MLDTSVAGMDVDEAARVRLAARASTSEATLCTLADDPALTVRAAVALNPVYAPALHTRLAHDGDDRIRALLAAKMARLLPGLSGIQRSAAESHVHDMLMLLAGDAAARVRQTIAEALTNLPNAPRSVILRLANDPAPEVSDPVVRFSPLLTDADLLELLATPPHAAMAVAVASRPGLSARLADEIADHAGSAAVQALLANRSATIQEATLDSLIGRAGDHPEWHEPLVCRPALPVRAMRALSLIVAGSLLDKLVSRADVPPELVETLRNRVSSTLAEPPAPSEADVLDSVRRMNAAGELTESALIDAVTAGNPRLASAILAVCGGVTLQSIERAVGLRSAKALVSLVARAGFGMESAMAVQGLLGRLGPGERLGPDPDGAFPLTTAEMDWQVELLDQPGR